MTAVRLLGAAALVGGALAAPAGAQAKGECKKCEAAERDRADEARRELRGELRELRREVTRLERAERDDEMGRALRAAQQAMAAATAAHTPPPADGWLGIAYSGDAARTDAERGPYFQFRSYPVIASVDPASPAEAAGLEAGDTIIAFDGRDVRGRKIYHGDVLRPGSRLRVRVRRGGRTRDARVAVRTRAEGDARARLYAGGVAMPPAPPLPPVPARPARPPRPPRGSAPMVSMSWGDAAGGPGAFVWSGPSAVAGAELARMNADLRDALGVREGGVLVLAVGGGTPAAEAGLRAGDVILRADGRAVTSPDRLQRAVAERTAGRRVRLDVARGSGRRTVTLHW